MPLGKRFEMIDFHQYGNLTPQMVYEQMIALESLRIEEQRLLKIAEEFLGEKK